MNRQILEEASAWFVDFRSGDATPAASGAFSEWLRRSPEHIRAYLQIAETYADVPALKHRSDFDIDTIVATARAESNVHPLAAPAAPAGLHTAAIEAPARRTETRFGLAATIFITVGAAIALMVAVYRSPIYTTQTGEQRSISLEDGSSVQLNARSLIHVRYTDELRTIELLRGQALFRVAKNAKRPFIVIAGDTRVRAVGTEFDVYKKNGNTVVTVIEGRVAVIPDKAELEHALHRPGDAEIKVAAGQQLTVSPIAAPIPEAADVASATAWTQRRLIFSGTPLAQVAEEFNRYNARQIVIDSAELGSLRISGAYASTEPSSLIRFLRTQPAILVEEDDARISIRRKP